MCFFSFFASCVAVNFAVLVKEDNSCSQTFVPKFTVLVFSSILFTELISMN